MYCSHQSINIYKLINYNDIFRTFKEKSVILFKSYKRNIIYLFIIIMIEI